MKKLLLALAIAIGTVLLSGVIIQDIWAWFIAPVFAIGLLTYGQAIGLGVVTAFLRLNLMRSTTANDVTTNYADHAFAIPIMLLVFYGYAAIIHWIIG